MSVATKGGVARPKTPFEIYRPEKRISHLKIAVYGDPGVGKTTLAATAPKPIFINAEAGDVALRNKDVDVIRVGDFSEMTAIMNWLEANQHTDGFYQTVVIDSLTELQRYSMDMVLRSENRDMPHQADWGRSMDYVRRLVRRLRDLDMHAVLVAGAIFREDHAAGTAEYMPNLPGKLGPEILGYVDVVGYLVSQRNPQTKQYVRSLKVQPTSRFKAKDRTNTLGAEVSGDNLNISKMIERVNGKEQDATIVDETAVA